MGTFSRHQRKNGHRLPYQPQARQAPRGRARLLIAAGWAARLVGSGLALVGSAVTVGGFPIVSFIRTPGLIGTYLTDPGWWLWELAGIVALGLGMGLFEAGRRVVVRGKQRAAAVIESFDGLAGSRYVLYLRPFSLDSGMASLLPSAQGNPFATTDAKLLAPWLTYEEVLVRRFRRFGPVIAIGEPGQVLPLLGATRGYLAEADWQETVSTLIAGAHVVLLAVGPSPGAVWEYTEAVRVLDPARLVLLVDCDLPGYEVFRAAAAEEYARRFGVDASTAADPSGAGPGATPGTPPPAPPLPALPDLPLPPERSQRLRKMAARNNVRLGWGFGRMGLIVFDADRRATFVEFDPTQQLLIPPLRQLTDRGFKPVRTRLDALSSRRELRGHQRRTAAGMVAGILVLSAPLAIEWAADRPTPSAYTSIAGPDGVWSLAVSPDGRLLAAGTLAGTIRLWDIGDPGHPRPVGQEFSPGDPLVYSLAFSPDGSTLAEGTPDSAWLWDVSDPARPRVLGKPFAGTTDRGMMVAFSPGGRVLAGADILGGAMWLADVSDPAHPSPFPKTLIGNADSQGDPDAPGCSVAFSPDGRLLAGTGLDGVWLWNVADPAHPVVVGQEPPLGAAPAIASVAFSPDGRTLAGAGFNRTIRLWDVSDPVHPAALGSPLTGFTRSVPSIAFSPDGRMLVGSDFDDPLRLWNVSDPARPVLVSTPVSGYAGPVTAVTFSRDGKLLVTAGLDQTIRLWKIR